MAIAAVPSMSHLDLPLKTAPKPKQTETTAEAGKAAALQELEDRIFEEIKELGLEAPMKDIRNMLREALSQM